jgi:hypothetical protein
MFKDEKRQTLQTGIPKESHMLTKDDVEDAVFDMLNPSKVF